MGYFAPEGILCPAERWSLYDRAEQGLLTPQATVAFAAAGTAGLSSSLRGVRLPLLRTETPTRTQRQQLEVHAGEPDVLKLQTKIAS